MNGNYHIDNIKKIPEDVFDTEHSSRITGNTILGLCVDDDGTMSIPKWMGYEPKGYTDAPSICRESNGHGFKTIAMALEEQNGEWFWMHISDYRKKYAALFVREDSAYKKRPEWDAYDADRNALTYRGSLPVVCHPPCRSWGVMSHMAFRTPDWSGQDTVALEKEKLLAIHAVDVVRNNGGVIEHPSGSKLFKTHLPDAGEFPDSFGGYTIEIDQFDFGHVAHKQTKLYICGVNDLPKLPCKNTEIATRSIAGNVPGTKTCTQYQREYTPELLIDWFEKVLDLVELSD